MAFRLKPPPPSWDAREALQRRKVLFAALNAYVRKSGAAWLTCVPGAMPIRLECRIGSSLPDDLKSKGYDVAPAGSTMRIDAVGHVEMVAQTSSGALEVVTAGSTKPTQPRTGAQIVQVEIFELSIPSATQSANRIPE